jgi:uncharacterized protein YbjQ (UPF0145 family)
MNSTTNTPFEQFSFAGAVFLTVFLPLLVFGLILVATLLPGTAGNGMVTGLTIVLVIVGSVGIPAFCILCAVKIENDHLSALAKAEAELSDIVVSDMRMLPSNWMVSKTVFITENVVLGNDYFKAFRWWFRRIVGGESTSYSRLLSRARREATVRVLRKAKEYGANVVWNIRYETSVIYSNTAKDGTKKPTGVEILAYATAFTVTAE